MARSVLADARDRSRRAVARITAERGIARTWIGLESILSLIILYLRNGESHGHRPTEDFHAFYLGLEPHEREQLARTDWVLQASGLDRAQWSAYLFPGGPKRDDWVASIVNPGAFPLDRHAREAILRSIDPLLQSYLMRNGQEAMLTRFRGRTPSMEDRVAMAAVLGDAERREVQRAIEARTAEVKNLDLVARAELTTRDSLSRSSLAEGSSPGKLLGTERPGSTRHAADTPRIVLTPRELGARFGKVDELSSALTYTDARGRCWRYLHSEVQDGRKVYVFTPG